MYRRTIDPNAAVSVPELEPHFTGPALQLVLTSPESSPELEVRVAFFAKGAISHWHSHPYPQVISVLEGVGRLKIDNIEQEIRPGEFITLPANVWHWHGASAETEMRMLSIMRPGRIQWYEGAGDPQS